MHSVCIGHITTANVYEYNVLVCIKSDVDLTYILVVACETVYIISNAKDFSSLI